MNKVKLPKAPEPLEIKKELKELLHSCGDELFDTIMDLGKEICSECTIPADECPMNEGATSCCILDHKYLERAQKLFNRHAPV